MLPYWYIFLFLFSLFVCVFALCRQLRLRLTAMRLELFLVLPSSSSYLLPFFFYCLLFLIPYSSFDSRLMLCHYHQPEWKKKERQKENKEKKKVMYNAYLLCVHTQRPSSISLLPLLVGREPVAAVVAICRPSKVASCIIQSSLERFVAGWCPPLTCFHAIVENHS